MAHLNIVLHEPEIPANTGNIGRTCVATGTRLHLIKPLGFDISDKAVKRAGLDYWPKLDVTVYESYEDFLERNPGAKIYYATTKGPQTYVDVAVCNCFFNDFLTIGNAHKVGIKTSSLYGKSLGNSDIIFPRYCLYALKQIVKGVNLKFRKKNE